MAVCGPMAGTMIERRGHECLTPSCHKLCQISPTSLAYYFAKSVRRG